MRIRFHSTTTAADVDADGVNLRSVSDCDNPNEEDFYVRCTQRWNSSKRRIDDDDDDNAGSGAT